MTITPFRPYFKKSDYKLIETFWMKSEEYSKGDNSEEIKKELNEIIKELKYRNLKLSDEVFYNKILY